MNARNAGPRARIRGSRRSSPPKWLPPRIAALLSIILLVAACTQQGGREVTGATASDDGQVEVAASSDPTGQAMEGGTAIVGMHGNFGSFDPTGASAAGSLSPTLVMFDRIWEQDFDEADTRALIPVLKSNIATADIEAVGEQAFEFPVRTDAVFHDGEPVTPEDVAFSISRASGATGDIFSLLSLFVDYIEGASVANGDRIRVTTDRPVSARSLQQALATVGVVPQHVIEQVGDEEFSRDPVGSGPFKFVSATDGESVRVERFEGYTGPYEPKLDAIDFQVLEDDSARVAALRANEIDVAMSAPLRDVDLLENEGFEADTRPSQQHVSLLFNNVAEGTRDRAVRQALMYALDREAIVRAVLAGRGSVGNGPLAEFHPDYHEPERVFSYDPDLAMEMLAQAGYENPADLNIVIRSGQLNAPDVAQLVADNWRSLGVNVELTVLPDAILFGDITEGDTDYNVVIASGDTSVISWDGRALARWLINGLAAAQFALTEDAQEWEDLTDELLVAEGSELDRAWQDTLDFYSEVVPVHTIVFQDAFVPRRRDRIRGWALRPDVLVDLRNAYLIAS